MTIMSRRKPSDTKSATSEAAVLTGFIAAVQPDVALTGWNNFVSIDVGVGLALLGRQQYGMQDFGGPVQFGLTMALQIQPFSHAFAGFRFQHFSDAGMYGSDSLGIDLYLIEVGYRF